METMVARDEGDLETVAQALLRTAKEHAHIRDRATLLLLRGELGAGKTALTKALGRVLGIKETITSPTFVIMKMYNIVKDDYFKKLVHIDAYRIEDVNELHVIHFEDLLKDTSNYIVIEWPERIQKALPEGVPIVTLEIGPENERIIKRYGTQK